MENLDPLSDFMGNLADKIKLAKDHKIIMDAVKQNSTAEPIADQPDPFVNLLQKISDTVASKLPAKEQTPVVIKQPQAEPIEMSEPVIVVEEPLKVEAAAILGQKIKEAIEQAKKTPPTPQPVEQPEPQDTEAKQHSVENDEPIKTLGQKIKDAIEKAKAKALLPPEEKIASAETPAEDEQIATYIDELEKIKDTGTVTQKQQAKTTLQELKEYIDKTVRDYSRRILDLGGGGGSVAVQYAKGGTMDGNLNVNGHILSGGRNISDYFGTGGGGGDPAVNTVVYTNSANWNSTYTTVNTYSGTWSTGIQTLGFDENTAGLTISNGNTVSLSALSGNDINSILNYFSSNSISISALTVTQNLSVGGTLYSANSALVLITHTQIIGDGINTVFGVTHNFDTSNVIVGVYDVLTNIAVFPAITVSNSNTVNIAFKKIPALNSYRVVVFGSIPSNRINAYGEIYTFFTTATGFGDIPVLSGNWNSTYITTQANSARWESNYNTTNLLSANWNSVYTSTLNNSAKYESVYSTTNTNSASWSSVYNTYKSLSASYASETLAIAYAVAL